MCFRSKRSHSERKDRKELNELSGLSIPPAFSNLSVLSLKFLVRKHGEFLVEEISDSEDQISGSLLLSGAPKN